MESGLEKIAKGLDHGKALALESVGINISNSLIISFSLLTFGMITSSIVTGLFNSKIQHSSQKYGKV